MSILNLNGGHIFNSLNAKYQQLAQGETATTTYHGNGSQNGTVNKMKNVVMHRSSRLRAFVLGGMLMMLMIAGWGYEKEELVRFLEYLMERHAT